MASRHFSVKHGKIGRGGKHALYIAGQGNYADKDDVIYLLDVNMPTWARDGADFFAAADKMERSNGRTYTEFEFAIPREITDPIAYARQFAHNTLNNNHPYRLAVHDKLASDGGRNIHAHLMFTERRLDGIDRDSSQFFLRANPTSPEKGGAAKDRKWHEKNMVKDMRQTYSDFAKSNGIELDLRSNIEQGLDEAEPKIGPVHDRSMQNKNRANVVMKVEKLRDERLIEGAANSSEQRHKFDLQKQTKDRRKQLWTNFHAQRRANYSRLAVEFKVTHADQKEKLARIKSSYIAKREAIKHNTSLKYLDRRAAISIVNMERITEELAIKAEFESIRKSIKIEQNEHYFEKYRIYLESQANQGDEVAQAEMTRLIVNKSSYKPEVNSIVETTVVNKINPAQFSLKYVSQRGEVIYQMGEVNVIRDSGKRVDLLETDAVTIEVALRLAKAKFGSKLTLTGSREFQEQVAMIAAEKGLAVEFVDPAINKVMQVHRQSFNQQSELQTIKNNLNISDQILQKVDPLEQKTVDLIRSNVIELARTKSLAELIQTSLSEAEKFAKAKGFKSKKPTGKRYKGTVIAMTSHHVIQHIGKNEVVIHELVKIDKLQPIKEGAKLDINYTATAPIVKVELSEQQPKLRTR